MFQTKKGKLGYHLGKLPARYDKRTIKLSDILVPVLPPLPTTYYVDSAMPDKIPYEMFGNDQWGDCVMVSRTNHILRFEDREQKKVLPITTSDVLNEYWKEQGACRFNPHPDNGMNMLDAMNYWRRTGWTLYGNRYDIYAFASVNFLKHTEVMYAIYLLDGIQVGVMLPRSAEQQTANGQPWDITDDTTIAGGHAIYVNDFDVVNGELMPVCETWAVKQPMTWRFWDRFVDECYAVVDDKDKWVTNSPVDVNKLSSLLQAITHL
jgi:hypothetical protein